MDNRDRRAVTWMNGCFARRGWVERLDEFKVACRARALRSWYWWSWAALIGLGVPVDIALLMSPTGTDRRALHLGWVIIAAIGWAGFKALDLRLNKREATAQPRETEG